MKYEDIPVGAEIPPLVSKISIVQIVMYCAVTWDFARYHYDPEFARAFDYPRPLIDPQMHGAFMARMLTDWICDAGKVKKLSLRYRVPCYLEDTLTYSGIVVQKYKKDGERCLDCDLTVSNKKEEHRIDGTATIIFH